MQLTHPPGYENSQNRKTYEIKASCNNCGERVYVEVPKGTLVKEYLKNQVCPNCDCRDTLEYK